MTAATLEKPRTGNMTVKLDSADQERLKSIALSKKRTPHFIMREALHKYLEAEEAEQQQEGEMDPDFDSGDPSEMKRPAHGGRDYPRARDFARNFPPRIAKRRENAKRVGKALCKSISVHATSAFPPPSTSTPPG